MTNKGKQKNRKEEKEMQISKGKTFVFLAGFLIIILMTFFILPTTAMADGETVSRETLEIPENGEIEFTLKAGQTITFYDIPAGTPYQIWEETPDGWVVQEQTNSAGKIASMETIECNFVNKYEPGIATASIHGTKIFNYKVAESGAFCFVLEEDGETVQSVWNEDGGTIQFDTIVYEAPGIHVYTVYEDASVLGDIVSWDESDITWDTHKETVTVTVTQDGDGSLHSRVLYDDDGILFNNGLKKGVIEIEKQIINGTLATLEKEFNIKIALSNPNGSASIGTYHFYIEGNDADTRILTLELSNNSETFYPSGSSAGTMKYVNNQTEKAVLRYKEWPESPLEPAFLSPYTGEYSLSFIDIIQCDVFGAETDGTSIADTDNLFDGQRPLDLYAIDKETGNKVLLMSDFTLASEDGMMSFMDCVKDADTLNLVLVIKEDTMPNDGMGSGWNAGGREKK
jgi:pilin isopeptide linkage protein